MCNGASIGNEVYTNTNFILKSSEVNNTGTVTLRLDKTYTYMFHPASLNPFIISVFFCHEAIDKAVACNLLEMLEHENIEI